MSCYRASALFRKVDHVTIPARGTFVSIVLLTFIFGLGLQPARGDSATFTGTACVQTDGCLSASLSGPSFSLNLGGQEPFTHLFCTAGTVCDFAYTIPAPAPCDVFIATGSFNGQAANCVDGSLTFKASPPTYVPILSGVGIGVEYILPIVVNGQMTGYEGGTEEWAVNIDGTGTMDARGVYEGESVYLFGSVSYQFSGIAHTPEPPTGILVVLGAALVSLVIQWKSLSQ